MIYQAALTLHIIGIVLFAGTTFVDFFVSKQFWKIYSADRNSAGTVALTIGNMQKVAGWGGRIIILAGIVMICLHPVWLQQTWFRVKMGVLVFVLINGGFRQKLGKSLHVLACDNTAAIEATVLRNKLNRVQLISLALLTLMFILSVFKFN